MRQVMMKTILVTAAVLAGLMPTAWAYSLGGPIGNGGDGWQVPAIGYGLGGDENAPKNLGESYRRNTPFMFYTYDQSFADYFGSSGIAAVDNAYTVLNQVFTNSPKGPLVGLDAYSYNLAEVPLETRHINYQGQALGIIDLKSQTLGLMVEQLGLTDPVRYAWTLHDRYLPAGGTCPLDEEYLVVQRNFDIVSSPLNQVQYSPYVNNVLYSYEIEEACSGPPPLALAVPFSADPLADAFSPVASSESSSAIFWGDYLTGLTRDDVAGLRYLLQTNNVNFEDISADSVLYSISTNGLAEFTWPPPLSSLNATNFTSGNTNFAYYVINVTPSGIYGYGDLIDFLAFTKTNPPALVQAAYPGVVISSYTESYSIATNITITGYFTNFIGSPYLSPPLLVVVTNYTPFYLVSYNYQFANVFTNTPLNHVGIGTATLITSTVWSPPGSPFGSPGVTNSRVVTISQAYGDFFVLPPFYTNVCPMDVVLSGVPPTILSITNGFEFVLTNTATTNLSSEVYTVRNFTNYTYLMAPVTCTATAGASDYYQGVEKIQFEKQPLTNYDELLGQFITPITNNYTLIRRNETNGLLEVQYLQRILNFPDFLFTAEDLATGPGAVPIVPVAARNLNFDQTHILPGLAGPGTITTPTDFTWNKSGPVYFNTPLGSLTGTPYFTETPGSDNLDLFYGLYYVLGSFDGTTNVPTVYPNGTSIANLQAQMLVQVSPSYLANGSVGQPYPAVQFTATGGLLSSSLSWSAAGLPNGLTLSSGGLLSGTPTLAGTYDFTITLTDASQTVQWAYTITIQ